MVVIMLFTRQGCCETELPHLLKMGLADGRQAQEKMLNIVSLQGNAHRNHNETPPHTHQHVYI